METGDGLMNGQNVIFMFEMVYSSLSSKKSQSVGEVQLLFWHIFISQDVLL